MHSLISSGFLFTQSAGSGAQPETQALSKGYGDVAPSSEKRGNADPGITGVSAFLTATGIACRIAFGAPEALLAKNNNIIQRQKNGLREASAASLSPPYLLYQIDILVPKFMQEMQ